jgi:hypothetical protein
MLRTPLGLLALVAGCRHEPVARPVAPPRPVAVVAPPVGVRLVVADDDRARFVTTAPGGLAITREVKLPDRVIALAWVTAEPVVLLDGGEVGHIAASGYVAYPEVPTALWFVPQPTPYSLPLDPPIWDLIVDAAGVVWEARCDWGAGRLKNETISCDAWVYARVSGPMTIARTAPEPAPERAVPVAAPSAKIEAEIVDDGGKDVLRCTDRGKTTDFPPVDERIDQGRWAFEGMHALTWLAADPPLFQITMQTASMPIEMIFAGCEVAPGHGYDHVIGGPQDTFALLGGGHLSVRRGGQELGDLESARFVRFAP